MSGKPHRQSAYIAFRSLEQRKQLCRDYYDELREKFVEAGAQADFKPDMDSYNWAGMVMDSILEKNPQTTRLLITVEGIILDGGPKPSGVTRDAWHHVVMLISKWKDIQKG